MSIEVVRQIYAGFEEGDMDKILSLISEDCQWDHRGPTGPAFNSLYVGPEGVREFFETFGALQETVEFETTEFFESGDRVVALGRSRFRVRETGKEWESDWAGVYTVEDGLIKSWRPIFDYSAEVEAFRP
jgi:ketosteroid isomerase-like protein